MNTCMHDADFYSYNQKTLTENVENQQLLIQYQQFAQILFMYWRSNLYDFGWSIADFWHFLHLCEKSIVCMCVQGWSLCVGNLIEFSPFYTYLSVEAAVPFWSEAVIIT